MPYVLQLVPALKQKGWKVRIHDSERLEPPHVTIYQKSKKWRLSLRDDTFLDKGCKRSQIDKCVWQAIKDNWDVLIAEWDKLHPANQVHGEDDE